MSASSSKKRAREEDDEAVPTLKEAADAQRNELLSRLEELSQSETDLTLALDDGEVHVLRLVLIAASEYFRRMLSKEWDGGARKLILKGVSSRVFGLTYSFMCNGSVKGLTTDIAQEVLVYAEMINLVPLCGACRKVLEEPDVGFGLVSHLKGLKDLPQNLKVEIIGGKFHGHTGVTAELFAANGNDASDHLVAAGVNKVSELPKGHAVIVLDGTWELWAVLLPYSVLVIDVPYAFYCYERAPSAAFHTCAPWATASSRAKAASART